MTDFNKWVIVKGRDRWDKHVWYTIEPSIGFFAHPRHRFNSWQEAMNFALKKVGL